ncbi:MAG TPA: NlpC/P60 family protein [Paracoccaceae bacterium]|nr:NlpC/P60 family protein [Paracoccaceae bacterium]
MKPDRRLTPARPDLAARHLAGLVEAARFADPAPHRVAAASAPLRPAPDEGVGFDTELLHGEDFAVYEVEGGWAWGQAGLDGYVGYLPAAALSPAEGPAPDHRVRTQWATVYARPVLKTPPTGALPFGARVAVLDRQGGFVRIGPDRWLHERHVAPLSVPEPDWVAVAERFLGTPYVWGGRSPAGIDCSGLVQVARQAAGHACPRDSDMQAAGLGRTLGDEPPRRGDLVFWRGHVAVMVDEARIVHANGHFMETVVEPLATATARIEGMGAGPVTRRARLDENARPV